VVPIISAGSWLISERSAAGFLAKMREQQKHPRKPPFARIEKLVDQVFLDPAVAVRRYARTLGKRGLVMQRGFIATWVIDVMTQPSWPSWLRYAGMTVHAAFARTGRTPEPDHSFLFCLDLP